VETLVRAASKVSFEPYSVDVKEPSINSDEQMPIPRYSDTVISSAPRNMGRPKKNPVTC